MSAIERPVGTPASVAMSPPSRSAGHAGALRRRASAALALIGLALAGQAAAGTALLDAAAAKRLFNARGCNACHAVDEQRLGPPFRAVAVRYRADGSAGGSGLDPTVEERLVQKVLHGGAGAWGIVPMVSNPRLPEAEARAAVRYILALEPAPPPAMPAGASAPTAGPR